MRCLFSLFLRVNKGIPEGNIPCAKEHWPFSSNMTHERPDNLIMRCRLKNMADGMSSLQIFYKHCFFQLLRVVLIIWLSKMNLNLTAQTQKCQIDHVSHVFEDESMKTIEVPHRPLFTDQCRNVTSAKMFLQVELLRDLSNQSSFLRYSQGSIGFKSLTYNF